jgi:hypothetical protein
MSSGKRKRDEYPGQLPTGSFMPQQDGSADQVLELVVSKVLFKIISKPFFLVYGHVTASYC